MRGITWMIIGASISFMVFNSPVDAGENCKLEGSWRLVSFYAEDVISKAQVHIYGERPSGYMTVTCDGRFYAWVESAPPLAVQSVWEDVAQAIADRRAIYYSGTYRLAQNSIVIRVDNVQHERWIANDGTALSWTERQSETDEVRNFRVVTNGYDGETLVIETAPMLNQNGADNLIVGRTVWKRTLDWLYARPN